MSNIIGGPCKVCGESTISGHHCFTDKEKQKNVCGNSSLVKYEDILTPAQVVANPPVQQQPINLIIGIPTGHSHDVEWSSNFALNFIPRQCPPNSGVIFENRYGIAQSREAIVNTFLRNPMATHLLFYDTDILPIDSHAITTLINDTLQDQKKYIVSGCYYNSLYTGLAAWQSDVPLNFKDPNNIVNTSKDPLIEVDKVGMGLCMIRKDLFKLLVMEERPLFFYKILEGNVMQSEDFVFFDKLVKYNIKPFVDTRVRAQHIKRCKINWDGGVTF
jgi:hypothetical protein